jgi:16S rRNA (adenine1518-N6/adenine1519-N6)-dimethyltransferase
VARLRVREGAAAGLDERLFLRAVSAGFAQKRKTILNNLRAAPAELRALVDAAGGGDALLDAAGIDPRRRAEALTLEEWAALTRALHGAGAPAGGEPGGRVL